MDRRAFIKNTAALMGSASIMAGCTKAQPSFALEEMSIADMQAKMQAGELSSVQLTEMYMQRIYKIDKNGPKLNSVIELNPDAINIAKALDTERQNGKTRSPLHGIPILIKDNIDTKDNMDTTAGSLALVGNRPAQDAFVIKKLRDAGAVILGKTNLSEWANFRDTRSTSGWSGRGGQTRNPYALDRNPCGSSSGSGVAVSANLCAAALGTETNGSVVCPSSINGIVGIKPTLGLVSRSGIIPIAHTQDTAGPMARTVADAALLLSFMTGADAADPITENPYSAFTDYTQFLNADGLTGKRIGVARNFMNFHDKVDSIMETAIADIVKAGATIVDPANLESTSYGQESFDVLMYEFKNDLNKYLAKVDKNLPVHSLEELIEFNVKNKAQEMPYFGQDILEMSQEKDGLDSKAYQDALASIKKMAQQDGIDATLKKYDLDAIIAPTNSPAWPTDWINGDHYMGGSSSPAAIAGYPNITVPAGFVQGLPIGISFFSTAFHEKELIEMTFAYEQATRHRQAPQFLKSIIF